MDKCTPKEMLYKTAFSPLYDCFVKIEKVRDMKDFFIFHCTSYGFEGEIMFTNRELDRFCF